MKNNNMELAQDSKTDDQQKPKHFNRNEISSR